jgi:REP element-mobilizing transposase RayT
VARQPRFESPDAILHVYSRGNYKSDIFADKGAAGSFVTSIHETTLRSGWHLFTYAVMPNHFHLMLRTPRANLARGMHLMLSGFAIRFNGLRDERGHVFQGRYHAKRMPSTMSAGRLFDYINLNLVRKGLTSVDGLALTELCAVRGLCNPALRGETRPGEALERFIGYPDSPDGWASYNARLKRVCLEDPDATQFESDWSSGEISDRRQRAANPMGAADLTPLDQAGVDAHEDMHTDVTFERLLAEAGKSQADIDQEHGVRPWKLTIAREMMRLTTVSLPWLVRRLNAGSVSNVTLCIRNGVRPH